MWRGLYTVSFLFLIHMQIYCVDIGSDTAPERFNTRQILDDGDRVAGFASLDAGFALNGMQTTATWDTFFPISGQVSLNFGTLILNRDFIFHNISGINVFGNIVGNGHALQLPCIDVLPSVNAEALSCLTYLVDDSTIADNNIFTLDWGPFDDFLAVGLADGGGTGGETLYVYFWDESNDVLSLEDSVVVGGASPDVNDVKWHPFKRLIALVRDFSSGADEVWTYSFDPNTSTLTAIDSAAIPANTMGVGWGPFGEYIAVGSEDTSGQLRIYPVDEDGNLGTPIVEGLGTTQVASEETTDFNSNREYVAIGVTTNGSDPELYIYSFDEGAGTVSLNASLFIGEIVEALEWSPTSTDLIGIGLASSNEIRMYEHNPTVPASGNPGSLTLLATSPDPQLSDKPETISFNPIDGSCFVVGADGPPGEGTVRTYLFDRDAGTITVLDDYAFQDDVEVARWSSTGRYLAAGSDNENEFLIFEAVAFPISQGGGATRCAVWSDLKTFQQCNLFLFDTCITFTGDCIWDGRGHCLELASTVTFHIAADSSLMFRDISLKGLSSTKVQPLDSTSTLSFNNAEIILSHNYTFSTGRLDIIDDVIVSGTGCFIFSSPTSGHVNADSRFMFDKNMKLRYEPLNGLRTNFILDDSTSQLVFDTAALSTSSAGMQLTKGKIMFDGLCMLINEGTSDATALEIGDGVSATNNVIVRWLPACNVELLQGQLTVNNV